MTEEKNSIIKYNGSQISMFSDERNDYVNLTDIANANKGRKSILTWLRSANTINYLDVWEKKHNPKYDGAQMSTVLKLNKDRSLSIKNWVDLTKSIGIFTRAGAFAGTYAHKDIAIKFSAWISPEFEMFLIEEIQRLKEIEKQKYSFDLLTHDQVKAVIRLKEVFKYVAHQEIVEDAHKDVFVARSNAKNPFAEFNVYRNETLNISAKVVNERIKQYCIDNNIALTTKILNKTRREKLLMMDSYESVSIAVWDFLEINGDVNALNIAKLVGDILKIENTEVIRENKTDLFHIEQDLGEFNDFSKQLSESKAVKTAREVIEDRKRAKGLMDNLSPHNKALKQALDYDPNKNKKT